MVPAKQAVRTALFIDGGNMHGAQKDMGWWIDYPKMLAYFGRDREVVSAFYFSSSPSSDRADTVAAYKGFKHVLVNAGYTVVDKEVKMIRDTQTGRKQTKADLDVEFTMNVIASMDWWDEALLFTGDSDFAPLAMHLSANGKRVVCVATRRSVAWEMRNAAMEFIPLENLRAELERKRAEDEQEPETEEGG